MKTNLIKALLFLVVALLTMMTVNAQTVAFGALMPKAEPTWRLDTNGDTLIRLTIPTVCPGIGSVNNPEATLVCTVMHWPTYKWVEKHPKPKPSDAITITRGEWEAMKKRISDLKKP